MIFFLFFFIYASLIFHSYGTCQSKYLLPDLTLYIYNDDNEVTISQKNNGDHNATITLNGSQPTILDLLQRGNTTQNYTLSQNCITTGGCNVTVTQGN